MRQLDGLRAVAILVVLAYHSGVPGFDRGGFYGQDIFFVLSGFLITGLLLAEHDRMGKVSLAAFWSRRARRLLPALAVMLIATAAYVRFVAPPGQYLSFKGEALATAFYGSNWWLIGEGSNYFASTGAPSLLTHTWSLAVEEQFYLAWPVAVVLLLRGSRRRGVDGRRAVLVVSAALALASAAWMAVLHQGGASPSRLYYGTDTHSQCLLVGAALAAAWPAPAPGRVRLLALTGLIGAAATAAIVLTVAYSDTFAYDGGFLVLAVAVGALIAGVVGAPGSVPARILASWPAVRIGSISYGMYLWFLPVFTIIDHSATGLSGMALFGVRLGAVGAIAAASRCFVEAPVQRARLFRVQRSGRSATRPLVLGAGAVAAAAGMVAATVPGGLSAPSGSELASLQLPARIGAASAGGPGTWATSPAAGGPATRTLLITGDSTALTLGLALSGPAGAAGIRVVDDGRLGCGVAMSSRVLDHGVVSTPVPACNSAAPAAEQWPALLRQEVQRVRPAVVLVAAGRWEVLDRRPTDGAPWTAIDQAADARYVQAQLRLAIDVAAGEGARVLVATSPCFASGEEPDGSAWPEDGAARLRAYDAAVDAAVRAEVVADPGRAAVLDLGALVCPGGVYHQRLDGITVRAPDGIHYPFFSLSDPSAPDPDTLAETEKFGSWMFSRMLPALTAESGTG